MIWPYSPDSHNLSHLPPLSNQQTMALFSQPCLKHGDPIHCIRSCRTSLSTSVLLISFLFNHIRSPSPATLYRPRFTAILYSHRVHAPLILHASLVSLHWYLSCIPSLLAELLWMKQLPHFTSPRSLHGSALVYSHRFTFVDALALCILQAASTGFGL